MESVKRFFTNEHIMLVLVLLNTSIIFISGFLSKQGETLLIIDGLFTLLFLFEAVIKIHVSGFSGYWSEGWNRFDFYNCDVSTSVLYQRFRIGIPKCEHSIIIEDDACI